jgi:hypothetical protein
MTPEERTKACDAYLRCCEMISRSRENGDIGGVREWETLRDQWYLVLRRDAVLLGDMHPERGPQGDAAL